MNHHTYSRLNEIPVGKASDHITKGCLVLEGGAFRGMYTQGVLDLLMKEDLNFECTIGCSAGAMSGINYVSGQIGRAAKINLTYRHDSRYVGLKSIKPNHGVIGFDFVFDQVDHKYPFDRKRFFKENRRFVAVATDCITGKAAYFEKGKTSDILAGVQASASMPFASKMVKIGNSVYLDGGCSDKIPFQWGIDQGYDKVIVVRTREDAYRKPASDPLVHYAKHLYQDYPKFMEALEEMDAKYNQQCDEIEQLAQAGKIFVISPSSPVTVGRLEKDVEKLGDLYVQGYSDAKASLPLLRKYLE
ncbi:patatin-like phospholipase family protein [Vagococcus humatus]|uniref:Patatin family protein n=1 Tax=Vagococcus humatus TaxID=1889241 RepID=A0A3R9YEE8_9ENTE|nr:patatin family protein [Vagococcus humatus]RST89350.1 patatin family protein [Vagococcus humatus]